MKKMFMVLGLAFLIMLAGTSAFAQSKTVTVTYTQTIPSPNNLAGWNVYYSTTSGSGYVQLGSMIAYTSTQSSYTGTESIAPPANSVTTYYFVMNSQSIAGNKSSYSAEKAVIVDTTTTGPPTPVIVNVVIQ